jgi:hypothetical protein
MTIFHLPTVEQSGVPGYTVTIGQVYIMLHILSLLKQILCEIAVAFPAAAELLSFFVLCEDLWTVTWSTYLFVFIFLLDIVICSYDGIRNYVVL